MNVTVQPRFVLGRGFQRGRVAKPKPAPKPAPVTWEGRWHADTSAESVLIRDRMSCPARSVGHYFRKVGGGQVRCEHCGAVRKVKATA